MEDPSRGVLGPGEPGHGNPGQKDRGREARERGDSGSGLSSGSSRDRSSTKCHFSWTCCRKTGDQMLAQASCSQKPRPRRNLRPRRHQGLISRQPGATWKPGPLLRSPPPTHPARTPATPTAKATPPPKEAASHRRQGFLPNSRYTAHRPRKQALALLGPALQPRCKLPKRPAEGQPLTHTSCFRSPWMALAFARDWETHTVRTRLKADRQDSRSVPSRSHPPASASRVRASQVCSLPSQSQSSAPSLLSEDSPSSHTSPHWCPSMAGLPLGGGGGSRWPCSLLHGILGAQRACVSPQITSLGASFPGSCAPGRRLEMPRCTPPPGKENKQTNRRGLSLGPGPPESPEQDEERETEGVGAEVTEGALAGRRELEGHQLRDHLPGG